MNDLQKLLLDEVGTSPAYGRLVDALGGAKPGRPVAMKGLRGSSLGAIVAALAHGKGMGSEKVVSGQKGNGSSAEPVSGITGKTPELVLLLTSNYERAGEIFDDLQWFGVEKTFHYPKSQVLPYPIWSPATPAGQ